MSQPSRPLRQGLWQPRFSIRHDAVITVAELNSLRQRLQSIDRLVNRVAETLQQVRVRSPHQQDLCATDAENFDVAEKLQTIRQQIATGLQIFSQKAKNSFDFNYTFEFRKLIEDVDMALAGCCNGLKPR